MNKQEIVQMLNGFDGIICFAFVGSRVTCNPPVEGTDIDIICHFKEGGIGHSHIESLGFSYDGDESYAMYNGEFGFASYSHPETKINLVCTEDSDFYSRFIAASSIAKRLNLLDKSDRIALFQAVIWGNSDEQNFIGSEFKFISSIVSQS